jgi:hypothetical protein
MTNKRKGKQNPKQLHVSLSEATSQSESAPTSATNLRHHSTLCKVPAIRLERPDRTAIRPGQCGVRLHKKSPVEATRRLHTTG